MKAIKFLQYVTIIYGISLLLSSMVVLFFPSAVDNYIKVIGAIFPYLISQSFAAFAGNPLKKFIEGKLDETVKTNLE